ncbi:hypothetical protein [Streptomyces sp. NEAU-YJ-81]|uniref:hypothetical protein n=1 Tax=Streptomyces sp. NEAU-YJ-81 TaxID=2820288 RepID=UPI001ABC40ED|nr:hypothetical protein [Streptomyces sp. NEAU-YJ-81]
MPLTAAVTRLSWAGVALTALALSATYCLAFSERRRTRAGIRGLPGLPGPPSYGKSGDTVLRAAGTESRPVRCRAARGFVSTSAAAGELGIVTATTTYVQDRRSAAPAPSPHE